MATSTLEKLADMPLDDFIHKGICIGHSKTRTHAQFLGLIKARKGNFYIINPEACKESIIKALKFLADAVKEDKNILFVGSRLPHRKFVLDIAGVGGYPYLTSKWIGGLLTNFPVIKKRIDSMNDLEKKIDSEEFKKYTKKEQLKMKKSLSKMRERFEGLKNLSSLPDAIFLLSAFDLQEAKREANKVGIPVIAICDTDANPKGVDYPIFANDDSLAAVSFVSDLVKEVILKNK